MGTVIRDWFLEKYVHLSWVIGSNSDQWLLETGAISDRSL